MDVAYCEISDSSSPERSLLPVALMADSARFFPCAAFLVAFLELLRMK